jgi:hypothetical protein
MATRFELVALALPHDSAPESLPQAVTQLIAACWPGMSRAQLIERARRLEMRASLRAEPGFGPDGLMHFRLILVMAGASVELRAHVRSVHRRRKNARRQKSSSAPARDVRQRSLF